MFWQFVSALWIVAECMVFSAVTWTILHETTEPVVPGSWRQFLHIARIALPLWSWLTVCVSLVVHITTFPDPETLRQSFACFLGTMCVLFSGGVVLITLGIVTLLVGSLFMLYAFADGAQDYLRFMIILAFYAQAAGLSSLIAVTSLPNWFCAYKRLHAPLPPPLSPLLTTRESDFLNDVSIHGDSDFVAMRD
jgi:hypothetical protein